MIAIARSCLAVLAFLVLAFASMASLATPAAAQQCPNSGNDCVVAPGGSLTISTSDAYSGQTIVGLNGTLAIVNGGLLATAADGTSDGTFTIGTGGTGSFGGAFTFGTVAGTSLLSVDGGSFYVGGNLNFGLAAGANVTALFANGAQIHGGNTVISGAAGSVAQVTLTGSGSYLRTDGSVLIGTSGTGSLTVAGGATVAAGAGPGDNTFLGTAAGGVGTLTVTGAGSVYTLCDCVLGVGTGAGGTGTLIIANGGIVDVPQYVGIASQSTSVGRLVIGAPEGQPATAPGFLYTAYVYLQDGDASIVFNHTSDNYQFNPSIQSNAGAIGKVIIDAGTTVFTAANSYTGGTYLNGGTLSVSSDSNLGDISTSLNFNGGALRITGTSFNSTSRTINWGANGGTFDIADAANTFEVTQLISGTGGLGKAGAGFLTLSGANTYTGATTIAAGTLIANNATALGNGSAVSVAAGASLGAMSDLAIGSLSGAGVVGAAGSSPQALTIGTNNTSTIFSGTLVDNVATLAGADTSVLSLVKTGTGALTLSGTNTYTGQTTVNAGSLIVDGSIASSSLTTVNAGATLGGSGVIGTTLVDGGTLAPGNPLGTLKVQGDLTFTSAAQYMIDVASLTADRTNVTGTATLGGATVNASFDLAGSVSASKYTILNATTGVSDTFNSRVTSNLPTNFKSSLSYDLNNAYLTVALDIATNGLSSNQQAVANRAMAFFNTSGSIPIAFGALTPLGMTQAAGETSSGAQQTTFDAMTQFMGLMSDPFSAGRSAPPVGATGFAAEDDALAYAGRGHARDAFAMFVKAPPKAYEARWNVWAAGFGGARTTDGNIALGSNRTSSGIAGAAVGADYWLSPATVAGFSMAGGGTNFSVANGGSGNSDLFQAGAFVRHSVGTAYVSAAAAYGWQDIRTDRLVTGGAVDRLRAEFNANTFSGRIETGNRWLVPSFGGIGVTPYAAVQVTAFDLPAYAETSATGGLFALNYAAKTVTDTRSELGLRTDKPFAVTDAVLTLRGRAAWAHDFNADRAVQASFQSLPGAGFVVNGASGARDAALTSASAEMSFLNGISLAASFEGEFSDTTRSYAGKGVVRYAW